MKKIFSCITVCMLFINITNAKIWRLNNMPGIAANYLTLQAAHDDTAHVKQGDTLYVEPSPYSYGNLTSTRKLTIVGAGYFITENPETQFIKYSSKAGDITLTENTDPYNITSSEGTTIIGLDCSKIKVAVSNVAIIRNRCSLSIGYPSNKNITNITVKQNYLSGLDANWIWDGYVKSWTGTITNLIISNNYITGISFQFHETNYPIILNNVIECDFKVYNATIRNNIMKSGTFTANNNTYSNNIGVGTQFGNLNGNQQNISLATIFVGPTGNSTDGQWQLKTGSPAKATGAGGVDCGMFGGNEPYILSGLPNIPAIYDLRVINLPNNNSIRINVKVKSHL